MDAPTLTKPESLVADVISTWRAGARPDTAAVLAKHPELRQQPSVILDLAYEEYCLRQEAGERISIESFCNRFPSCRRSLGKLLAVHTLSDDDSILAASMVLDEIKWPELNSDFLGFQLLRELGRGAFARVYLAKEPALGNRYVVVKVARYGATEAEMLGRLAHRNIVPVQSAGEEEVGRSHLDCAERREHRPLPSARPDAGAKRHRRKQHGGRSQIDHDQPRRIEVA